MAPNSPRWRDWNHPTIQPPRNRPILGYFPPYAFITVEYAIGGYWREVQSGKRLYDDFPTHWAENLQPPRV